MDGEIPQLRCAALGMTCGPGGEGMGPRIREDHDGAGIDSLLRLHGDGLFVGTTGGGEKSTHKGRPYGLGGEAAH